MANREAFGDWHRIGLAAAIVLTKVMWTLLFGLCPIEAPTVTSTAEFCRWLMRKVFLLFTFHASRPVFAVDLSYPSQQYIAMPYNGSDILDRELKKGSAELLILSLVEDRPRHGYEIANLIEQRSGGLLRFN